MKRTFLGIDLSPELKSKIERLKKSYNLEHLPLKLVEPENSHIAIRFLDDLDEQQLKTVSDTIEKSLVGFKSFEVEIKNSLIFPNQAKARVLTLKVISSNLLGLAKKLFKNFEQLDFIPAEEKAYQPHITLGRVRDELSDLETEKIASIQFNDKFLVDSIQLFESKLTDRGPIYSILKNFRLK